MAAVERTLNAHAENLTKGCKQRSSTPHSPVGPCAQTHASWSHLQTQRRLALSNGPPEGTPKRNEPSCHAREAPGQKCLVVGSKLETSPNGVSLDKKQPRSRITGGGRWGGAFLPARLGLGLHSSPSSPQHDQKSKMPPTIWEGPAEALQQLLPATGWPLRPLSTHVGPMPTWGR